MNPVRKKIAELYREDPVKLAAEWANIAGSNILAWDEAEFSYIEEYAIEQLGEVLEIIDLEVELLREQFADDKGVQYALDVMAREGVWYTLVHKFDVGAYTGPNSTLAVLAMHLKAINKTLTKLVNELEEHEN
jgi:hypothetical protein